MISRSGNKNFLAAHYDWLALIVGVLVLAGGAVIYALSLGDNPDEAAAEEAANVARMKPAEIGVKGVDMSGYLKATGIMKSPLKVADVSEVAESFLASERRVLCKCGKAISGDVKLVPKCPYCGEQQQEEKKAVLDTDQDGLPDEWEKKFGLNVNDPADASADTDGDDFTNLEEFEAKTDPTNKNDHPDYLDSLKVLLPLKETYMPFVFLSANKIPAGWRCEFFDAKQKDDYGRLGRTITAVVGEAIGESGFVLKSYEKKETKRAIAGGEGMTKTVDASEVVVERKSDGKVVKLVVAESKKAKPAAVDVQAALVYERGAAKNLEVVPGAEIVLSGVKYKISAIQAVGKGAKVTVENVLSGKKRDLVALEQ